MHGSDSWLAELKKAVETADRKLIALYQKDGNSVKTHTWDLSAASSERLEAYVRERNLRAQKIAEIEGHEVYPQMTLIEYRELASAIKREQKGTSVVKPAESGQAYINSVHTRKRPVRWV